MSRIDQALRRANMAPVPSNRRPDGVFESPWHVDEETGPIPAPPAGGSGAPIVDVVPSGESFRQPQSSPGTQGSPSSQVPVDTTGPTLLGSTVSSGIMGLADSWHERLATEAGNPGLLEQFTRLAATLYHAQADNGLRSVMITSALPGDGKTMTAVNLALVLSESYRKQVLLIDADLRHPSIAKLGVGAGAGLSEALSAKHDQKLALTAITPNLTLLPAGRPVPDPIAGLTSSRMRRIVAEAVERYDWVIIDAPPLGPVTDANLLAAMVDGTLLVVRAGTTQYPAVQKAVEGIGRERILGVVLNGADVESGQGYYYQSPAVPDRPALKS